MKSQENCARGRNEFANPGWYPNFTDGPTQLGLRSHQQTLERPLERAFKTSLFRPKWLTVKKKKNFETLIKLINTEPFCVGGSFLEIGLSTCTVFFWTIILGSNRQVFSVLIRLQRRKTAEVKKVRSRNRISFQLVLLPANFEPRKTPKFPSTSRFFGIIYRFRFFRRFYSREWS